MSSFSKEVFIQAKPEEVWKVLSEIGEIHASNLSIDISYLEADSSSTSTFSMYAGSER